MLEITFVRTHSQHAMPQEGICSSVGGDCYPAFVSVQIWITSVRALQVICVFTRREWRKAHCPLVAPSPERGYTPGLSTLREDDIHVHIVEGIGIGFLRLKGPFKHSILIRRRLASSGQLHEDHQEQR